MKTSARQGFTLKEILIVTAIIAVLAGLLFPAFDAVRASANATRCLSNLRQCAFAHFAYAADNRSEIPHTTRKVGTTGANQIPWMVAIAEYYGRNYDGNSAQKANLDNTASCPVFKRNAWPVLNYTYNSANIYQYWGYVRNNYLYQNGETGYLNQPNFTGGGAQMGDWVQAGWCTPFKLPVITYPSQRFLIGDGYNTEHKVDRGNSTRYRTQSGNTTDQYALAYQYSYLLPNAGLTAAMVKEAMLNDPHKGKRSYVMCDGSGKRLTDNLLDPFNQFWLSVMDPGRL